MGHVSLATQSARVRRPRLRWTPARCHSAGERDRRSTNTSARRRRNAARASRVSLHDGTVGQPSDGVMVKTPESDVLSHIRPIPTVELNPAVVVYAGRPLDPPAAPSIPCACEMAKQRRPYPAASRLRVHIQVIEPNPGAAKE